MRNRQPVRVSEVSLNIRRAVLEQPGIHFRGLGRAARVTSAGQLRHHLDRLERQGQIIEVEDGRYKRFFVPGDHDPKLRGEMARFARVVPRRIAKLLLVNPMNRTELRRSLGCADSTLGYHLTRMVMLGDLARLRGPNSCVYSLANEETVRKMLVLQSAKAEPSLQTPVQAPLETPAEAPAQTPDQTPANVSDEDVPNPLRPQTGPEEDLPFPARPARPEPAAEAWREPVGDPLSQPAQDSAADEGQAAAT